MIVFYYYRDNKNKKESLANNDKKKITNVPDILDNIDICVYDEILRKYSQNLNQNYLFQNIQNNFLNYY